MKKILILLTLPLIAIVLTNIDSTIREGRYAHIRNMKLKWNHLNLLKAVAGDNYLKINSIGLKGDELGNEDIRILVIGNSLSEGMLLDDKETWPYQLQNILRKKGLNAKVFNSAKSGFMSAQRVIDVYKSYEKYKFDLVIVYPLGPYNENYNPQEGFSEYYIPDYRNSMFSLKNNTVIQQLRNRKWEIASYVKKRFGISLFRNAIADPNHVRGIQTSAAHRRKLPLYIMNPNYLQKQKKQYEKGISLLNSYFESTSIPVVLITRLHITSLNPTKSDLKLWWHDTIIDHGNIEKRFSADDYKKILLVEHSTMNNFIINDNFTIITQEQIKPLKKWFYDHNHFNEDGSSMFAQSITPYLLPLLN